MESTGEATDQNMLAPDWSPIHPRLLRRSRFKPCLWPDYLQLLETCMCDPNKSLYDGSEGFKKSDLRFKIISNRATGWRNGNIVCLHYEARGI